jgi:putative flavoprotein involved in K+ transport
MAEIHDAVVVGGGQAGLVASQALTERGLDHVVLERDNVAGCWRTARWDSLRFQFPNAVLGLPGLPYDGPEPEGFAGRQDVAEWLERYAALIAAPVREHTRVVAVERVGRTWQVTTATDRIHAAAVVVATGPFQRARVPTVAAEVPDVIVQMHSVDYRSPDLLPDGAVLVVGSGASGAQIAEELVTVGRRTYLCVSRHRRVPRRLLGRDITTWLVELGLMDRTRADWVDGRMPPTVLVTGVDGGHDLDLRVLGERGVTLLGSLRRVAGDVVHFADVAEQILAAADSMHDELVHAILQHVGAPDQTSPVSSTVERPGPVPYRPTVSLRQSGITSVIWATGYSFDFDWVHAPVFDERGEPVQRRGVTDAEGLYFLGLHWMHTFKSGTFLGIGEDADHVIDHLADYIGRQRLRTHDQAST